MSEGARAHLEEVTVRHTVTSEGETTDRRARRAQSRYRY